MVTSGEGVDMGLTRTGAVESPVIVAWQVGVEVLTSVILVAPCPTTVVGCGANPRVIVDAGPSR